MLLLLTSCKLSATEGDGDFATRLGDFAKGDGVEER
jgi:hypothetical protein